MKTLLDFVAELDAAKDDLAVAEGVHSQASATYEAAMTAVCDAKDRVNERTAALTEAQKRVDEAIEHERSIAPYDTKWGASGMPPFIPPKQAAQKQAAPKPAARVKSGKRK